MNSFLTAKYLMLRTYSLHLQDLSQFIQTSVEVVTELHEVLDVINSGEVDLHSTGNVVCPAWC